MKKFLQKTFAMLVLCLFSMSAMAASLDETITLTGGSENVSSTDGKVSVESVSYKHQQTHPNFYLTSHYVTFTCNDAAYKIVKIKFVYKESYGNKTFTVAIGEGEWKSSTCTWTGSADVVKLEVPSGTDVCFEPNVVVTLSDGADEGPDSGEDYGEVTSNSVKFDFTDNTATPDELDLPKGGSIVEGDGWTQYGPLGYYEQGGNSLTVKSSVAIESVVLDQHNNSWSKFYSTNISVSSGSFEVSDDQKTLTVSPVDGSKEVTITFRGDVNVCDLTVNYAAPSAVATFDMSSAGWATLCISEAFTVPTNYEAYTVGKDVDGQAVLAEDGEIVLTPIVDVPEGCAVIISGPAAEGIELAAPAETPDAPQVNFLQGNTFDTSMTYPASMFFLMEPGLGGYTAFGACQLYQLAKENDVLGFYRQVADGSSITCAPGKAILVVPNAIASSNARFALPGQDDTTGINAIATEKAEAIYNLQGQRVNATAAGIYVKNGKKFIVK